MDGITEPVVAVIGNPIAGNPTQFALERALHAMQREWRILSIDVPPEKIAVALEGIDVLGFRGVFVDSSVGDAVTQWLADRDGESGPIDCLYRDETGTLQGRHIQSEWISSQIEQHAKSLDRELTSRIWLGDRDSKSWVGHSGFGEEAVALPPSPDLIAPADVIVLEYHNGKPPVIEADDWYANERQSLVVDLTDGHDDIVRLEQLGYQTITWETRRIGTLAGCLQRWTGELPSTNVIREAIEEYLAV